MSNFFGREEELNELKSIWQHVRKGNPHVVNYIADTGVGKTRLVHAFYKWLSTDPKQGDGTEKQKYWPEDIGIGRQRLVNPPLDRFKPIDLEKNRIPWLWWGMYWTDAANDIQVAMNEFSPYLEEHLEILDIDRTCNRNSLDSVFEEFRDHGKDFAKDLAKDAVNILVSGSGGVIVPVGLSVYTVAKRILLDNRKRRKEVELGLGKRQQNQLGALADDLLSRLVKMFDSSASVPMVLFLDDIHFATDTSRDEQTLQFLDNLLRQAALHAWPLLVITTHWKAPWQAHLQATLENSKPWRQIEDSLKTNPDITDKLEFHDVHLEKMSGDDLFRIALDYLPGLNEESLKIILGKVDNARWLVELLNALIDCRENFVNRERSQALSPIGLSRLDELLLQQGYLGVIRQRLKGDEMADIRAVLGATALHSYGLDFLSPLADAFEKPLVEKKLLTSNETESGSSVYRVLMQALDPVSLIEGNAADGQLPDVIRFPERGYLNAARELFDKTHVHDLRMALGKRILDWMTAVDGVLPRWQQIEDQKSQKIFLGIASEVLGKLQPDLSLEQKETLANQEKFLRDLVKSGSLTEEQFALTYQKVREGLLAGSDGYHLDEAGKYQALAMAELVALLWSEGRSQAWELANALPHHSGLEQARALISDDAQYALVSIWRERPQLWDFARNWLKTTIECFGTDKCEESLQGKAAALESLADLDDTAGDKQKARESYQASLAIRERLLTEFNETSSHLRDIAVPRERLADLDKDAGDTQEAKRGYQDNLIIWDRLLASYGETADYLRGKAITLERLADLELDAGDNQLARRDYEASLVIWSRLLAVYGETADNLRGKTVPMARLAKLDRIAGDKAAQRQRYQEILSVRERVLTEYGETQERLLDKCIVMFELARLDKQFGNMQSARQSYQDIISIRKRMLTEYGKSLRLLTDLPPILESLADLDNKLGNKVEAIQGYKESLTYQEYLIDRYGESDERLTQKRITQFQLNEIVASLGN